MTNTQSPAPGVATLPCPFCGEQPELHSWQDASCKDNFTLSCCARMESSDKEALFENWNARAALQASAAAVPVAMVLIDHDKLIIVPCAHDGASLARFRAIPDGAKLYTAPPLPAQVQEAEGTDANYPFYELKFIMRVLGHSGGAPKQDWETAYGMAREIFIRWSQSRTPAPGMAGGVVLTNAEIGELSKAITDYGDAKAGGNHGMVAQSFAKVCTLLNPAAPHPSPAPQAAGVRSQYPDVDGHNDDGAGEAQIADHWADVLPLHVAEVVVSNDDLDMGFSEAFIAGKIKLPNGTHKLYTDAVVQAAISASGRDAS